MEPRHQPIDEPDAVVAPLVERRFQEGRHNFCQVLSPIMARTNYLRRGIELLGNFVEKSFEKRP